MSDERFRSRKWWKIRLSTVFWIITVCAVLVAWRTDHLRQRVIQQELASEIEQLQLAHQRELATLAVRVLNFSYESTARRPPAD